MESNRKNKYLSKKIIQPASSDQTNDSYYDTGSASFGLHLVCSPRPKKVDSLFNDATNLITLLI